MDLDLQIYLGSPVQLYSLAKTQLLVTQDRLHLFVTPLSKILHLTNDQLTNMTMHVVYQTVCF